MAKGFFITGTDTGVGKTIIAGAVIKAMGFLGLKTCGMKPVESGCGHEGDVLIPYDGMFLKQISHVDDPITVITPCCFENPLAPLSASEIEMTDVSVAEIKKAFKRLSDKYEAIVVEGIGGLMVPLRKNYYTFDLARELELPLIVVAKPGLGTVNHVMLTVNYALKEGLEVAGLIINYSNPPDNSLAEKTNPKLLNQISPVPIIGTFPYLKNLDEDIIEKTAIKNLDLEVIKRYL
ncbi:MAG: dethiobiotin synthase [Nitrospirae bacterium]|nr:dethiobiotin synthase [Nitrospirota bacterium]